MTTCQWGLHLAPGHLANTTNKAVVVMFTKSLGRDYAEHGVRVNDVCPGQVRTPMVSVPLH